MNHRVFVAIDLPERIKEELSTISYALPGAKWIDGENLHLTLQFIGEVDGLVLEELKTSLVRVHSSAFPLHLQGLGYFSRRKTPSVLWISVDCQTSVVNLQKKIKNSLFPLGLKLDHSKFSPHITLARLKDTPIVRLQNYLYEFGLFKTSSFMVHDFSLISSQLTPKGAKYTIESNFNLSAPA